MSEDKSIGKKFFKSRIFIAAFLAVVFLSLAYGVFAFFKVEPIGSTRLFLGSAFDLVKETFSSKNDKAEEITLSKNNEQDTVSQKEIFLCPFENDKELTREGIILNEVAWMGSGEDYNNEWIELKNISDREIDISGWQLIDKDEQMKIVFENGIKIESNGLYLLERNEDAVLGVKADILYSGNLKNSDEGLRLFNNVCDLTDEVIAVSKWPAGNNASKKTMERDSKNFIWHTSQFVGGTPRSENSASIIVQNKKEKPKKGENLKDPVSTEKNTTSTNNQNINNNSTTTIGSNNSPEIQLCSQENLISPTRQVLLNEVAWAGTASDKTADEWIELKNISSNSINLNGWQLLNKLASIKIIFDVNNIVSNGFFLLERTDDNSVPFTPADKIFSGTIKNNDESLRLFDNNCHLIDEVIANADTSKNWPAGNASPDYRTAERGSDLMWHSYYGGGSSGIFGTPKFQNSENPGGGGNNGNNNPPQCTSNWSCGNWSVCLNGTQTRTCSDQNSCGVNINKPVESQVCVLFYTLTVSKSGNGTGVVISSVGNINCGVDCEEDYFSGDGVTLEAFPEDGSVFTGWEGACSGTGSCMLTMNNDLSVTAIFNLETPPAPPTQNVLISEIMVGMEGNVDYEFVELYNPNSQSIDLTGYSLKKKTSTGNNEDLFVSSVHFRNKIIPANGYLLLADIEGYSGSVSADISWPQSYALAYTNNTLIFYNVDGVKMEEIFWVEILPGQSYERQPLTGNQFVPQLNPNPQNSGI